MSKLLLNEEPLLIMPGLATKIGLNESIILQQFHYWLNINKKTNKNFHDGYYWTYNTYVEWQDQFPFWSVSTIKRTVYKLEKMALVVSTSKYNKMKIDKTKWYRIDYDNLERLEHSDDERSNVQSSNDKNTNLDISGIELTCQNATSQNETSNGSKCYVERVNLNRAIPETSSEISSKIIFEEDEAQKVITFYEEATSKKLNKLQKDKFNQLIQIYPSDIIIKAIEVMIELAEIPNIKYLRNTLKDWYSKGIDSLEKVEKMIIEHEALNKKAMENKRNKVKDIAQNIGNKNNKGSFTNYTGRGWEYYEKFIDPDTGQLKTDYDFEDGEDDEE